MTSSKGGDGGRQQLSDAASAAHSPAASPGNTSSAGGGSRRTRGRSGRRAMLNPAFAAAHGIPVDAGAGGRDRDGASAPPGGRQADGQLSPVPSGGTGTHSSSLEEPASVSSLTGAIANARRTGRLNLSNLGLVAPLPDECFEIRRGLSVDLALDSSDRPSWEYYGEESLIAVDFSDNDLSGGSSNCGEGRGAMGGDRGGAKDGDNDTGDGAVSAVPRPSSGLLDARVERYESLRTLRARRCHLAAVPLDAIGSLTSLNVLDLSGNAISHAIPLAALPPSLNDIDLSSNAIPALFEDQRQFEAGVVASEDLSYPSLVSLNVSRNRLTMLFPPTGSDSIRFSSLKKLHFSHNCIEGDAHLDAVLSTSKSLTTLEGTHNRISVVPNLADFDALTIADFSDNRLDKVPPVNMTLVRLTLCNNRISSLTGLFLDDGHSSLRGGSSSSASNKDGAKHALRSNLVELRLRGNKIRSLNERELLPLTSLQLLDVGCNDLTDLPHVMGYLPALRRVLVDGNALRVIRPSLAEDTDALKKSLRRKGPPPPGSDYLSLEIDGSVTAPTSADVDSSSVIMEQAHTVDLSNRQLEKVPSRILDALKKTVSDIGDCSVLTAGGRVKTLALRGNNLQTIEGSLLSALPNLSNLDAGQNHLENLPIGKVLDQLPLTSLLLDHNGLSFESVSSSALCPPSAEVATALSALARNLSHLDLSSNRLQLIPGALFRLPSLSTLVLSYNRIRSLAGGNECEGDWRPGLPSLVNVDLSNNRIADLGDMPAILGGCCPKLRSLVLANNELKAIPPEIGLLEGRLRTVDLRGNPQKSIRPAVLERGCDYILSFLRGRMDEAQIHSCIERQRAAAKQGNVNSFAVVPSVAASGGDTSRSAANDGGAASAVASSTSVYAIQLRDEIEQLTSQLGESHLSQAKKYALKKSLAVQKSKLIREERRLKNGG